MNALYRETEDLDHYGFLLIDARNAFNELQRISLLYHVRHLWPRAAKYVYNCYSHHSTSIVRSLNGKVFTVYSQEGIVQGDPILMFCYAIGILPLCKHLKTIHADCQSTWYADDSVAAGTFEQIEMFFDDLTIHGPSFGYHPEPSKSILIVKERDVESAAAYFKSNDRDFKIVNGHRYL